LHHSNAQHTLHTTKKQTTKKSYADALDWLLVALGVAGALVNGAMLPLFTVIFGDFTNAFGSYVPECVLPPSSGARPPSLMSDAAFASLVSGIALKFLYLALGAAGAGFLQQASWSWAGTRQANRLRRRYLAAVLRQDIAFFDTQATTGGLLQGLNEDSAAVQEALSDKVGTFLQHMSTFLVGYIIAFTKGWDMTLVMVGCLPFLAAVGAVLAKMTTSLNNRATTAYTDAGSVVQQALSQVCLVCCVFWRFGAGFLAAVCVWLGEPRASSSPPAFWKKTRSQANKQRPTTNTPPTHTKKQPHTQTNHEKNTQLGAHGDGVQRAGRRRALLRRQARRAAGARRAPRGRRRRGDRVDAVRDVCLVRR
jgi:hypothetical protein